MIKTTWYVRRDRKASSFSFLSFLLLGLMVLSGPACEKLDRKPGGLRVDGQCDNTQKNKCTAGTPANTGDSDDSATHYKWHCNGSNGGSHATDCQLAKNPTTVNGQCDNSVRNGCTTGTLANPGENTTHYTWHCNGSGNGRHATNCQIAKGTTSICSETQTPPDWAEEDGQCKKSCNKTARDVNKTALRGAACTATGANVTIIAPTAIYDEEQGACCYSNGTTDGPCQPNQPSPDYGADQDGTCKPSCSKTVTDLGKTALRGNACTATGANVTTIAPTAIYDEEQGACCYDNTTTPTACTPASHRRDQDGTCKPSCSDEVGKLGTGYQVARGSDCTATSNFTITTIPASTIHDEEAGTCCGRKCIGLGLESIVTGVNSQHSCGIVGEHKNIQCWGNNARGQIGNGCQATSRSNKQKISYVVNASSSMCYATSEVPVTNRLINAKKLALGVNHTCALLDGNEMCCWGQNDLKQLGKASFTGARSTKPIVLDIPKNNRDITENIEDIVAGDNHTCILTKSNRIYCWGDNSKGQAGFGSPDGINKLGELSAGTLSWHYNTPFANFAACAGTGAGDCLKIDEPREISKNLRANISTSVNSDNGPPNASCDYAVATKRTTDINSKNIIVLSSDPDGDGPLSSIIFHKSPDCSNSTDHKVPRCNEGAKCSTLTGSDLVKEINARLEAEEVVEYRSGDNATVSNCSLGSSTCKANVVEQSGNAVGFQCSTRYCSSETLASRNFFIDNNNRKFWTKTEHENGIWPNVPPNFPCEKLYDPGFMTSLSTCRDTCTGSWDSCPQYADANGNCPTSPTTTTCRPGRNDDTTGTGDLVLCTCSKVTKDAQSCLSLQSRYRVVFGCSHDVSSGDVNQVCKDFIKSHQDECNVEKKKWEDIDTIYRRLNGTFDVQRTRYAQISAGANHTCATTVTGEVHCWGDNSKNQLGAVVINPIGSDTTEDAGDDRPDNPHATTPYCVAEKDSRSVTTNDNFLTFSAIPQVVKDPQNKNGNARRKMSDVVEVASGADFSCGMIRDGDSNKLKCWGDTAKGLRGNLTAKTIHRVALNTLTTTTGTVLGDDDFCFDYVDVPSSLHQCSGTATEANPNVSNRVALPDVTGVLAGRQHVCTRRICLNGEEEVLCWGDDSASQIGRVISSNTTNSSNIALPVVVSETGSSAKSLVGVTNLFVNKDLSCSIQRENASDKVVCWGTYHNPLGGTEDDIVVTPSQALNQCVQRTTNSSASFLDLSFDLLQSQQAE